MTTGPDQLEALGWIEPFEECLLPPPSASFLHILRTRRPGIQVAALPPAWRAVQLALARALSLPIHAGENHVREPCTEIVDGLPHRYNHSLKKLLAVLYYHQVQELVREMNTAGADTEKERDILGKLAVPLQRYTEAVEAAGNRPPGSDPIRRSLYKFFDLPFITINKSRLCITPLIVVLNHIGRSIRKRGIEARIHGAIDIFARVVIALAGGLILIVPVILMRIFNGLHNRLIIMCCFVILFAVLIGIFTRAMNHEVLAVTAVYTAFLAVSIPDRTL